MCINVRYCFRFRCVNVQCRWGAVSWALFNMAMGQAIDIWGTVLCYYCLIASSVAFMLQLWWHAAETPLLAADVVPDGCSDKQSDQTPPPTNPLQLLRVLCSDLDTALLLFVSFVLAMGMSLVENLLFLFMVEDLNSSNLVCGISVVVTVVR